MRRLIRKRSSSLLQWSRSMGNTPVERHRRWWASIRKSWIRYWAQGNDRLSHRRGRHLSNSDRVHRADIVATPRRLLPVRPPVLRRPLALRHRRWLPKNHRRDSSKGRRPCAHPLAVLGRQREASIRRRRGSDWGCESLRRITRARNLSQLHSLPETRETTGVSTGVTIPRACRPDREMGCLDLVHLDDLAMAEAKPLNPLRSHFRSPRPGPHRGHGHQKMARNRLLKEGDHLWIRHARWIGIWFLLR